jgi:hypothetical protein
MKLHTLIILSALPAVLLPGHRPRAQARAVDTVAQLYRDFAWEAIVEEPQWPGHALLDQPRDVLLRYFDEALTDLILADRACAARTHSICRLDFCPIWNSQDPGATGLRISPTEDPTVVLVRFLYPSNRQLMELTYHMVETRRGWRVHDIDYGGGMSLLALLRLKEPG